MRSLQYLRELLGLFARWWWASITGVASILSWLAVPADGGNIGRTTVALLVFGGLCLLFIAFSAAVHGYGLFVGNLQPRVTRFVPASDEKDAACTFILDPGPSATLAPGYLISLYRNVLGEEVCVALLRFDRLRQEDGQAQRVPVWIGAGHLKELSSNSLDATLLRVRRDVPERIIDRLRAQA